MGRMKLSAPSPWGSSLRKAARSSHPYAHWLQGPRPCGGWGVPPIPSPAPWRASACSYGLVSSGLGALGPSGALHWRSSAQMGSPESPEGPEVTEPSRLVRESSGGEVRKPQVDTRVRQDPPRGTVSGAGWWSQGAGGGLAVRQVARVRCHHPLRLQLLQPPFARNGPSGGAGAHEWGHWDSPAPGPSCHCGNPRTRTLARSGFS